jgi:hypothetical protein
MLWTQRNYRNNSFLKGAQRNIIKEDEKEAGKIQKEKWNKKLILQ